MHSYKEHKEYISGALCEPCDVTGNRLSLKGSNKLTEVNIKYNKLSSLWRFEEESRNVFSVVLVCPQFYSKNVFRLDFFFSWKLILYLYNFIIYFSDILSRPCLPWSSIYLWLSPPELLDTVFMYGFLFGVLLPSLSSPLRASLIALRGSSLRKPLAPRVVFYLPEAVVLVIYIAWSNIPVSVFFFPSWQHDYNDHLSQGVGAKSLSSLSSSALENFPLSSVCPPILSHQF